MELPKNTSIFGDTNFLAALYNSKDALHQKSLESGELLLKHGGSLVISNYIFLETMTIVSQRAGKAVANIAGDDILANQSIQIIHVDSALHQASWNLFKAIPRKNMSFVDCSTIAIMHAENIKFLLTFDRTDFAPLRKRYHFKFFE